MQEGDSADNNISVLPNFLSLFSPLFFSGNALFQEGKTEEALQEYHMACVVSSGKSQPAAFHSPTFTFFLLNLVPLSILPPPLNSTSLV